MLVLARGTGDFLVYALTAADCPVLAKPAGTLFDPTGRSDGRAGKALGAKASEKPNEFLCLDLKVLAA